MSNRRKKKLKILFQVELFEKSHSTPGYESYHAHITPAGSKEKPIRFTLTPRDSSIILEWNEKYGAKPKAEQSKS